ncbi:hypothetical protein [Metapseudomonas furukawaii]|uniref:Type I restriction-modification system n=1 Tax=Metapseudomonas furukawaii TaxID=1149133 RepID=A0AAD1FIR4_METFU|nr:hypothetical protein [Pseudomonas furukawaii]ELS27190.1 Type I restriction-modification system, restriction subunit R [Pseudomonas furukawaii]BAU77083.1 type I restriction-modification system [Pseudomonas furukawaii]
MTEDQLEQETLGWLAELQLPVFHGAKSRDQLGGRCAHQEGKGDDSCWPGQRTDY